MYVSSLIISTHHSVINSSLCMLASEKFVRSSVTDLLRIATSHSCKLVINLSLNFAKNTEDSNFCLNYEHR